MNKLNLRHPLDGATLAILRRLRSILEAEGRTYFLVGATARDVLQILGGVRRAPFDIVLDRLDQFGGKKPRAVFAGAGPNPALIELQADHERLLQRIGLPPEQRKFSPHVTLARLRDTSAHQVADYLSDRALFRTPPFPVSRFVLFSSKSSTGGGPYVVEAAYPLLGEARMLRHE